MRAMASVRAVRERRGVAGVDAFTVGVDDLETVRVRGDRFGESDSDRLWHLSAGLAVAGARTHEVGMRETRRGTERYQDCDEYRDDDDMRARAHTVLALSSGGFSGVSR